MTSSKLVRMEDAADLVRDYSARIGRPIDEQFLDELRSLPSAGGEEASGAIEQFIRSNLDMEGRCARCAILVGFAAYKCSCGEVERVAAARLELQSLRSKAAERDSVVGIERLVREQRAWSRRTFGEGYRVEQLIAHIGKELAEVRACPRDTMEWIDVALLALDGAWRTGAEPEAVAAAMAAKQRKNFARAWPAPKNIDEPFEHDRARSATADTTEETEHEA